MYSLTLENENHDEIAEVLEGGGWIAACLCAGWCATCNGYRAGFEAMAARNPAVRFTWIDIEDQADIVGDLDVVNFPTLLLQKGGVVTFFGPVLPDPHVAERLIQAHCEQSSAELESLAQNSPERMQWQSSCNMLKMLRATQS